MTGVKQLKIIYKNSSKYIKKLLVIAVIFSVNLSSVSPLFSSVYADESTPSATIIPPPSATSSPSATLIPSIPQEESIFSGFQPTLTPTLAPTLSPTIVPTLTESVVALPSANLKTPVKIKPLSQNSFSITQSISVVVLNSQDYQLETALTGPNGQTVDLLIEKESNADFTTIRIPPSLTLKPGKYSLKVTDQSGSRDSIDFTWGNLALNLNKSYYLPDETGIISLSLADDKSKIVCTAEIQLIISNKDNVINSFSTSDNTIKTNQTCKNHDNTDQSDYTLEFTVPGQSGSYIVSAKAQDGEKIYTARDVFKVENTLPLSIAKKSATRIVSKNWQSVTLTVRAFSDFNGTVSDFVPEMLDIASPDDSAVRNYDDLTLESVWYNKGSFLGTYIPPQRLPFDSVQYQTLGFGDNLIDPVLKRMYSQFGLAGHDGIDFDLPQGTPIFASDTGLVVLAGGGDYGKTVVIEHDWGRSYYGHLSEVQVVLGQKVSKGDKLALSGNTGLSTGAHLHFSIKPNLNDRLNGYYGKINPLPYLQIPQNQIKPDVSPPTYTSTALSRVKKISWNINLNKGEVINLGYQYKTPQDPGTSYLLGPVSFQNQSGEIKQVTNLHQVISEFIEPQGAQFSQTNEVLSMEKIDPELLAVPDDFPPLKAGLDKELTGNYSALNIGKSSLQFTMSVASSSGKIDWVKLSPENPGSGVSAKITADNQITWTGYKHAAEIQYETYDGYLNGKIILQDDTAEKTFKFNMDKSENLILEDYFGHLLVKNKDTGEELFLFRFPQGIDSRQNRIDYKYAIEGNTVTLYPNRFWQFAKAAYPITIYIPLTVIAWSEALVQVGQNCSDAQGCGQDGDIWQVHPVGFYWGTEEMRQHVLVKILKVNQDEASELASRTIPPDPENPSTNEKIKEKIFQVENLSRYGIDYTGLTKNKDLNKIRDKNKKDFAPRLDSRNDRMKIKKKVNPLLSVVRDEIRLVYKQPNLFQKIILTFSKPVYAAPDVKTIGSASRNYTTPASWESTEGGGTLSDIEEGDMYNDSTFNLTTATTFDGTTTSSTAYMHLTAPASERHSGTAASGGVLIDNDYNSFCFVISDNYTRIEWLRMINCGNQNGHSSIHNSNANNSLVQNLLIYDYNENGTINTRGIQEGSGGAGTDTLTIRNTIIYAGKQTGIGGGVVGSAFTLENVTVSGNENGIIDNSSTMSVTNSISMNNSTNDLRIDTAGSSQSYNMCEDTASNCFASNPSCTGCQIGKTYTDQFVNTTAGSEDFHLKAFSDAIDNGTDLSANFSNDIDNRTRPIKDPRLARSGTWDIGADEFGPTNDLLLKHGAWWSGPGVRQPFTF